MPGDLIEVRLATGAVAEAKSVMIATGARWREINVPGRARIPQSRRRLLSALRRAAVQGQARRGDRRRQFRRGGRDRPRRTGGSRTVIEYDNLLRADAVLNRRLASLGNVSVVTGAQTTEVRGDGRRVTGLAYRDRQSGAAHMLELEGVFVQIGLVPNTDWLKGTLQLSPAARSRSTRAARPPCRACSRPATAPSCPTSRSSLPWARAPRHP